MTGYFFDLYPRTNPLGTVIARLTEAQALKYRGEANGAGVGLISLRGDSDDGQLVDPLGLQYIRVREDDETVVGGFFLDNGDFAAINEQNTRLLTFTGAGALSYLDREVMWAYTYHPTIGADDPFDREWRLYAQGFGLGDYLGNSFYRALFEGLGFNGATGYRTVTPRNGEKFETAIPAITIGFDGFEDSDGNPWTLPSGDMTVGVGETLYKVAQRHMQAGLYIEVDPDTFECRAWEADGHRRDRTGVAFGADVIRFSKGQNIKDDASRALAPFIKRTEILSVGSDDTASTATFSGDVPWHGSVLPDLTDLDAIHQVAVSEGNRRADAGDTLRLKMRLGADPANGFYRPWREVLPDDLATVDSGSSQWDWDEQTFPVAALEIALRPAGDWDAFVELGASFASMANRAFQAVGVAPHPHPPNPRICYDTIESSALEETFTRTEAAGGGTSELTPHVWTHPSGTTNISVDGDELLLNSPSGSQEGLLEGYNGTLPWEHEVYFRFDRAVTNVLQVLESGLFGPDYATGTDWATVQFRVTTGNVKNLDLSGSAGSTSAVLGATGVDQVMKLRIEAGQAKAKIWTVGDPEPDWQLTVTGDLSGLAAGNDFEVAGRAGHASNATKITTIRIVADVLSTCTHGGPAASSGVTGVPCNKCAATGNHEHGYVAAGGTTGQILRKVSDADWDTEWVDP